MKVKEKMKINCMELHCMKSYNIEINCMENQHSLGIN